MKTFLNLARAMSDESRVRALLALRSGELCVCQLIELLGLAPSTVSKHMTILVQADLVECRKKGRWHYYKIAVAGSTAARGALAWLDSALGGSAVSKQDQKTVKAICRRNVTEVSSCCYRNPDPPSNSLKEPKQ